MVDQSQTTFSANGAICYWILSPTNRSVIFKGFQALGLDHYVPNLRTVRKALKMATLKVANELAPHVKPGSFLTSKDVISVSRKDTPMPTYDIFYNLEESKILGKPTSLEPGFTTTLALKPNTALNTACYPTLVGTDTRDTLSSIYLPHKQCENTKVQDCTDDLERYYNRRKAECDTQSLSNKIVSLLTEKCNATLLRSSGGIYWVPQNRVNLWRQCAQVISDAAIDAGQTRMHTLTVKGDLDLVAAVKVAITDEITQQLSVLADAIDNPELGARALSSKKEQALKCLEKVVSYEAAIGETLTTLKAACSAAKSIAAQAELTKLSEI